MIATHFINTIALPSSPPNAVGYRAIARSALKIAWMLVALLAAGATITAEERPNIALILVDDMGYRGYSDISSYGGEIPTPNIDALAHGGVRMTNFHNTARCCPSRAALITGLYLPTSWRRSHAGPIAVSDSGINRQIR